MNILVFFATVVGAGTLMCAAVAKEHGRDLGPYNFAVVCLCCSLSLLWAGFRLGQWLS